MATRKPKSGLTLSDAEAILGIDHAESVIVSVRLGRSVNLYVDGKRYAYRKGNVDMPQTHAAHPLIRSSLA